jgi:hypothetical protein
VTSVAVQLDLSGRGVQQLGLVGHGVERDLLPEVPLRKYLPAKIGESTSVS